MKKILGVLAVVAGLGLWGAATARADGMIIPFRPVVINETGQRAVIWQEGKKETLIVSTKFKGEAEEFVWVVPVPSKPEVKAGKDELFTALEEFTRININEKAPMPLSGAVLDRYAMGTSGSVTVWQTKKVDIYDIAVLSATEGRSLREWLTESGYTYPASKEHLLNYYVDKGWFFVAAKVNKTAENYAGSSLKEGHATPLQITFETEQLVYPLKISGAGADWAEGQKIGAWGFESGNQGWSAMMSPAQIDEATGRSTIKSLAKTVLTNDEAWQGVYSLSTEDTSGSAEAGISRVMGGIFKAGKEYTVSGYISVPSGSQATATIKISGGGLAGLTSVPVAMKAGVWQRVVYTFVATATNHTIDFRVNNLGAETKVYWDGIQVEQGQEVSDFDQEVTNVVSPNTSQAVPIDIYVFSDHKMYAPGFTTPYAGEISNKDIERLAVDDEGKPWVEAKKKKYLTKLSRSMKQSEMVDDVVLRRAENDTPTGGGTKGLGKGNWVWLVLGAPLLAEIGVVGYLWYIKSKGRTWR